MANTKNQSKSFADNGLNIAMIADESLADVSESIKKNNSLLADLDESDTANFAHYNLNEIFPKKKSKLKSIDEEEDNSKSLKEAKKR